MSNLRHDRDTLVRTFAVTFSQRRLAPPQAPGWHQLLYASRGVLTIGAGQTRATLPPHRALWVPANTPYQLDVASGPVALRSLYFAARWGPRLNPLAVLNVTPLMRELIGRAVEWGALQRGVPAQRHLAQVIADELNTLSHAPLQLPMPADARALQFARLFGESAGLHCEAALLRRAGASRRTLERLFATETGMSLGHWMRRERLLRATAQLTAGSTVAAVAMDLGYNSASAFIAAFRREMGFTPGALDREAAC